APQADVQRHHGALTEADEGQPLRTEPKAGKLAVKKALHYRPGGFHAARVFLPIAPRQGEPLEAAEHAGDRLRRVGGEEGRVGQPLLPAGGQLDEILAVGAIPMQQDYQRSGSTPPGFDAWTLQLTHQSGTALALARTAA